jgi:sugar phosphate isomerase/epimerase
MSNAFGASQFSYLYSDSLEDALSKIAGHGLRYVELLTMPPHVDTSDPASWGQINKLLAGLDLTPTAVGPMHFDMNLASTIPAVRTMTAEQVIANVRFAAEIGAPNVVVCAGRRNVLFPAPLDATWDLAIQGLDTCLQEAAKLDVTLCIEPLPYSFINTGADIVALLDRVDHPNLSGMIDTANCHTVEGVETAAAALAGRISHVQLSDTLANEFRHDAVGKGEIDFVSALDAIKRAGYDGPFVLELCEPDGPDSSLAESMTRLRELGLA